MIDLNQKDKIQPYEIENVENQKQEYRLFGSFMRTKGLKLFAYNHLKNDLYEVKVNGDNDVEIVSENGKLKAKYSFYAEAKVNTSHTHFETVNFRTAKNRVKRFKNGIVKDLSNLKEYNPKPIYNF